MSAALVFRVSVALLHGAVLEVADVAVVGQERRRNGDPIRFSCMVGPRTVHAPEVHDEVESLGPPHEDRRGAGAMFVSRVEHDWSAFGAARAFVLRVPAKDVERELKRWERATSPRRTR